MACSYTIKDDICFLCICDKSYPRKLAFTYLADLASEFTTTYSSSQYLSPTLRPYAFVEFDTFIQRTKKLYQDSRASQNLDKLNDELRDVTKVMTKNIEDLLYRGDSLERMGELSGRLREDSKKYRKAAVRINWELLVKQVGPYFAHIPPERVANHPTVRTFRWRRACHLHSSLLAILLIPCSPWPCS
jgi:vesicle transport protein SEC22